MKKKIGQPNIYNDMQEQNSISDEKNIFGVLESLDRQKMTHYVIKQVMDHKVPMLTFWKQGEIYKVALPYEWGEKYFLVAKKKNETTDEKYDLRQEFRIQHYVYKNVHHEYVKTPELFGYQEMPNGEEFIVMEFVPGQTLYTLLLNKVIKKNKPNLPEAMNDREADTAIVRLFGVDSAKHMLAKIESTPYIYKDIRGMYLFTKEQAEHIKKHIQDFLDSMHAHGVYHRDLWGSLRNIMLCPDGKIYIIDFWKAIRKHTYKEKEDVYMEYTDHGINEYAHDEEILDIIDAYTEK